VLSKEQLLAAPRGEPVDRLPWAARIDVWFKARAPGAAPYPPLYTRANMWDTIRTIRLFI
jgi:hypothetical protein